MSAFTFAAGGVAIRGMCHNVLTVFRFHAIIFVTLHRTSVRHNRRLSRNYSGYPLTLTRDEGVASQGVVNSINDIVTVFADGRDVTANSAECLGSGAGAK